MASFPRIIYADMNERRQTPELRREASLAVHRPSVCSGVKALRNTSDAKAASRQAALAFRSPLTPSARSGNLIAGDGTKNGLSRSEQRTVSKPKRTISGSTALPRGKKALDRKSPIQVWCEPDFRERIPSLTGKDFANANPSAALARGSERQRP